MNFRSLDVGSHRPQLPAMLSAKQEIPMSDTDRIIAAILAGAKASAEGKTKIEEYANEYSQFLRFLQGQQEAKAGEQIKAVAATWREWGKEG